ncbi:MAG: hypothetical protein EKK48_10385 [Candidatus Melainabacteria bacterium]|nr:MAG: hypothetical protein EKK48_10385 [Candidatus Melainabacteria bacterium]
MGPLIPDNASAENYYFESHPRAKELLNDKIFWQPGLENGPTRGDTGFDGLHDFWEWRPNNLNQSVLDFVRLQLHESYGLSRERIDQISNEVSMPFPEQLEYDSNLYDDYLLAVTFAQFMAEGCVESQLKKAALQVVKRQTDPSVVRRRYGESNEPPYPEEFSKVVEALNQMNIC